MAKVCELCGKKTTTGNRISHSNRKTRTTWLPNLQKITTLIKGKKQSLTVCVRCLRTLKKKGSL